MGLEWRDIDVDNCTLEVRQASQYLPGKGCFVKDPKNETSKRLISVPANSITLLKKWKTEQTKKRLKVVDRWHKQNEKGEEVNWVFTTWDGRQMHPDTPSKWFNKFLAEKKLPHIPWHGLRHTSATLLIADGSDIREVSGRLGHADTSTTGNIYAHFLKKADQAAAEKMNTLMARRKKEAATKSS